MGNGVQGTWLAREKWEGWRLNKSQSFYAVNIEEIDPKVVAKVQEWQDRFDEVQRYLTALHNAAHTRNPEFMKTVEVPACLQETAKSGGTRKKQGTAPRSSSKSQSKRKKTQSSSSTSQKTAE